MVCCYLNRLPRPIKRHLITITCAALAIITLLLYAASLEDELELGTGDYIDITQYRLIEPIIHADFPEPSDVDGSDAMERIPRIVHQTWREESVPERFRANVESFVNTNPSFEYYFWTDASARLLIAERHPYLLDTFDNYVEPVRKADLLRYVVLYEYGGIYADLDTECLRTLDHVIRNYACVLSREPDVHAALIFNTDFLVTNSIMFCRRHHPFLKQLMHSLPLFSILATDIDASGPNYLTLQLTLYNKSKGHLNSLHDDAVFIAPSQYFQNNLDPVRYGQFRRQCRNFNKLNEIGRRGCASLKYRGFYRSRNAYTFTEHQFFHTGMKFVSPGRNHIKTIVPRVKIYGNTVKPVYNSHS